MPKPRYKTVGLCRGRPCRNVRTLILLRKILRSTFQQRLNCKAIYYAAIIISGFVRGFRPASFSQLKPKVAARIIPGIRNAGKPNLRRNSLVGILGGFNCGIKMIIKHFDNCKVSDTLQKLHTVIFIPECRSATRNEDLKNRSGLWWWLSTDQFFG